MKKFAFILTALVIASAAGFGLWLAQNAGTPTQTIRIGINPWPGYEFLYLADQKGFFKEEGLDVKTVQFSSLQDVRQAFERGQVDGMCSTLVEMLQAYANAGRASQVALVADYSNGADVILAMDPVKTPADLKGKKVGVEPLSLGAVMLARALDKAGLKTSDVEVLNIDALGMEKAITSGQVDAVVTYPPFSLNIPKNPGVLEIFNSTQIPGEIVDIVSFSPDVLEKNKNLVPALRRVWEKSHAYARERKDEAYAIMAQREGITVTEFEEALGGIHIMSVKEQEPLFAPGGTLESDIAFTAKVLAESGNLSVQITPADFVYKGSAR